MADLRDKLKSVLKKQEEESRKVRRSKTATTKEIWTKVLPQNYFEVIMSLSGEELEDWITFLGIEAKEETWNHISNNDVKRIFEKHENEIGTFFYQMSCQRKENFLKDETCTEACCDVFFALEDFSQRLEIMKKISVGNFKKFFQLLEDEGETIFLDFLLKLYEMKEDTIDISGKDRIEVFQKIAIWSAELLARLFEEADADVVCEILQYMTEEAKIELCQNYHGNVYELLEKTDFALLQYLEEFPVLNLNEVEWQDFFNSLEEREIDIKDALSVEMIQAIYCVATDRRIKEDILFNFLESKEMLELYKNLSKLDKMEMIEIMTGEEATRQYDDKKWLYMRENVFYILEQIEKLENGLTYFEQLVLKDLKARFK